MSATVGAAPPLPPADFVNPVAAEVPDEWARIVFCAHAVKRVIEFGRFKHRLAKMPTIAFAARSLSISLRAARRWYANDKYSCSVSEWHAMRRRYAHHLGEEVTFLLERVEQLTRESNKLHVEGDGP